MFPQSVNMFQQMRGHLLTLSDMIYYRKLNISRINLSGDNSRIRLFYINSRLKILSCIEVEDNFSTNGETCVYFRELVPAIKESKRLAESALQKCEHVDDLIQDWWHQPALHLNLQ